MGVLVPPVSSCTCSIAKSSIGARKNLSFFGNKESNILVLLSHKYNEETERIFLRYLEAWGIKKELHCFGYALGCTTQGYKDENRTREYLTCKKYNIKKKIEEISPKIIIAEGYALATLVEHANISPESFYNDKAPISSFFYCQEFSAWVFPISSVYKWVNFSKKTKSLKYLRNYHSHFTSSQIRKALEFDPKPMRGSDVKVVEVEDPNSFLEENMGEKEVSFDLETTGLKFYSDKIICAVLSFDGITGYYLDWDKIDKGILNRFFVGKYVITGNGKFDVCFLWYNGIPNAHLNFDVNYAGHILHSNRSNGLKEQTYYYTKFGGYDNKLDQFKDQHKIKSYSEIPKHLMVEYAVKDAIMTFKLKGILEQRLNEKQLTFLRDTYFPVAEVVARMEMKGMYIDVEYLNKYKEKLLEQLKIIHAEIHNTVKDKIEKHNKRAKLPFELSNISSFDDIKYLFINVLKAEVVSLTEKGSEAVGEKALKIWSSVEDPVIKKTAELMLEYRSLSKLITSYLSDGTKFSLNDGVKKEEIKLFDIQEDEIDTPSKKGRRDTTLLQNIDKNNVVHASFNLQRVNIGRFSCSNPNLQQWVGKTVPEIRPIFRARDGYYLSEVDYAGFHLRLMAMFSKDEAMMKMFSDEDPKKRDMHSETAAFVFTDYDTSIFIDKMKNGTPEEQKEFKKYRAESKKINFGFLYGLIGESFAERGLLLPPPEGWTEEVVQSYMNKNKLGIRSKDIRKIEQEEITERQARYYACADNIRTKFFLKYKGVENFINYIREKASVDGYVESMYGFRVYLPELCYPSQDNEEKRIAGMKNEAVNYPIISTEANIMQRSMVLLQKFFDKEKLDISTVNQVHDSLVLEIKKDLITEDIGNEIKRIMCEDRPEYNGVRLDVEGAYSTVWGGHPDKNSPDALKFWFE